MRIFLSHDSASFLMERSRSFSYLTSPLHFEQMIPLILSSRTSPLVVLSDDLVFPLNDSAHCAVFWRRGVSTRAAWRSSQRVQRTHGQVAGVCPPGVNAREYACLGDSQPALQIYTDTREKITQGGIRKHRNFFIFVSHVGQMR